MCNKRFDFKEWAEDGFPCPECGSLNVKERHYVDYRSDKDPFGVEGVSCPDCKKVFCPECGDFLDTESLKKDGYKIKSKLLTKVRVTAISIFRPRGPEMKFTIPARFYKKLVPVTSEGQGVVSISTHDIENKFQPIVKKLNEEFGHELYLSRWPGFGYGCNFKKAWFVIPKGSCLPGHNIHTTKIRDRILELLEQ